MLRGGPQLVWKTRMMKLCGCYCKEQDQLRPLLGHLEESLLQALHLYRPLHQALDRFQAQFSSLSILLRQLKNKGTTVSSEVV